MGLSRGGLPANATATFLPTNLAANEGAQTVTLAVQTAGPATSARGHGPFEHGRTVLALGVLLLPLGGVRRMGERGLGATMCCCS